MKSILKFICWTILSIIALVLTLVLTIPFWLGPVVKPALKTAVPKLTKTSFGIRSFDLNPYTGRFALGGVVLGNPEGYSEPTALSIGSLEINVDMLSVMRPTIRISKVELDDLYVSYVNGGTDGANNFTQIAENVSESLTSQDEKKVEEKIVEEKKETERRQEVRRKIDLKKVELEKLKNLVQSSDEEKEKVEKLEREIAEAEVKEELVEQSEPEPRFVIDELVIRDVRVKVGKIPMTLPAIVLHDVGKNSSGVTFNELGAAIWEAIVKGLGVGVEALKNFSKDGVKAGVEVAEKTVEATVDALKQANLEDAKKVLDGAKEQLKDAQEQFKEAGNQLKDAGKMLEGFLPMKR